MDFRKKMESFDKRFGILDEYDPFEEFAKFKIRVLNIIDDIDSQVGNKWIDRFCTLTGRRTQKPKMSNEWRHEKNIYNIFERELDEREFFRLIEIIFYLLSEIECATDNAQCDSEALFEKIKEVMEISNVNLSILKVNGEVILRPRGEEVLDHGLVEEVFSFLNPQSQQNFIKAVKFYNERNPISYIESAESIRRSVEEFLRYKLKNQKGLAANISDLGKHLKTNNRSSEIRNIINQIFSYLDQYFNNHSKHNDGDIGESENEFLLYQAGLLMRYVNKAVE